MTKAKEIEREVIENIDMEALVSRLRVKGRIEVDTDSYDRFCTHIALKHRDLIGKLLTNVDDNFNIKLELKRTETLDSKECKF